jgi:creatinine amidohydrolase/Fe(II)-dependent formamide hydrolase-like protein
MKLHEMRPDQCERAKQQNLPLLVPAGTIEYHGEHLPLGVDTVAVIQALDELEKEVDCVVAPPIWYGPSSYAVAGPEKGTIDIDTDRFEKYVSEILKGFLENGFRRIYIVIHHQFEMGQLMPEALAFKKAAASLVFQFLERERGRGWWGSQEMKTYYENLGGAQNPFNWIQVIPLMSPAIQQKMGYDHAGMLETSLMMASAPDTIDLKKLNNDGLWFTDSAKEASAEHGKNTIAMIVRYLKDVVS